MSKLSLEIKKYLEENKLSLDDIKKDLQSLDVDLVADMLEDKVNTYVIKKSGSVEKFSKEKIERSIKDAVADQKTAMTASDIRIIVDDVLDTLNSDPRKVYKTSEIKNYVKDSLLKEGYSKVYKEFISYIKED